MGAAAVPIALALTAASTTSQVLESRRQRKLAEKESRRQEEEQRRIENDLQQEDVKDEKKIADIGKRTQRAVSRTAKPRQRETILTSPLGLIDEPETAQKTLLGR